MVSEIQNTPLNKWGLEWVRNRVPIRSPNLNLLSKPSASRTETKERGINDASNNERKEDHLLVNTPRRKAMKMKTAGSSIRII